MHGGIYPTTAGVPQSPQYGLAALFESASNGDYNFLDEVKVYSIMAKKIKIIFDRCGFELVYDLDMEEPIGDGFYFTIYRPGMSGEDLLFQMLRYGMAGIPLSTTGSTKEGVRICVSMIRESQLSELEKRLGLLDSCIKSL